MPLIAAISTPPGKGGIAVVRLSGPGSRDLLGRIFRPLASGFKGFKPWRLHHGTVLDKNNEPLDDVLAVHMPGPNTFTGDDVVEIHCHGSDLIAHEILESLLRRGARQAEAGEFTRRAFSNGRMDLSQAEAVAEMIAAPSREGLRYGYSRLEGLLGRKIEAVKAKIDDLRALVCIGLDFPDDEIESLGDDEFAARVKTIVGDLQSLLKGRDRARVMQEGCMVVLAGRVNAGKSSLLNALAGRERALVADIPGTTRDFLETGVNLAGLPICLVDTAGLRDDEGNDPVEKMGIAKSRELLEKADAIILVLDGAMGHDCLEPGTTEREVMAAAEQKPLLVVWNKCDICKPDNIPPDWAKNAIIASAMTGENIDKLAQDLRELLLAGEKGQTPEHGLAPNQRQAMAIEAACGELQSLLLDIEQKFDYDCWANRLDSASAFLAELLGLAPHEELLNKIFSQFCIGK